MMRGRPQVFIRARALTGLGDLVASLGGDAKALMAEHGLDPGLLETPDAILPIERLSALLEHGARRFDCPDFGLRLSRRQDIGVLGPLAFIALYSRTFRDAIDGIARHLPYHSPGVSLRVVEGGATGLCHFRYALHLAGSPHSQAVELSYGVAWEFVKTVAGARAHAIEVRFRHAPGFARRRYRHYFDCPLRFGQEFDELVFPLGLLDREVDASHGELREAAERFVRHTVRRHPLDLGRQVEALVDRQLANGGASVVRIAEQLHLSRSTLHRRLAEQELRFEEVVDQVRRRRVQEYLGIGSVPLHQVAALAGYTSGVSLHRSCMRWFGAAPSRLRARTAAASAAG